MKKIIKENTISSEQYNFDPFSLSMVLFENELKLHNIQYVKQSVSITRPRIKFVFYQKDIELVNSILNKIEGDSLVYEEKKETTKKNKKNNPEVKQRKVAIYILVVILILILFSIML